MGTNVCITCTHELVDQINADLQAGVSALATSKKFNLKYDTVKRHVSKGHVERIQHGGTPNMAPGEGTPIEQMRALVQSLIDTPTEGLSTAAAMDLSREKRQAIATLAKMAGPQAPQEPDLATSREWIEMREALVRALEPYPEALAAVLKEIELVFATQPPKEVKEEESDDGE